MIVSRRNQLRRYTATVFAVAIAVSLTSCGSDDSDSASDESASATTTAPPDLGPEGQQVVDIIDKQMKALDLTGAVYGVWRGDEVVAVGAAGQSPVGVPTAPDMQLRIGQPMEPMLSTVLLQLDGEGVLKQDEPISKWLPDFPRADQITPKMLADSTSGVSDYVTNPDFLKQFYANPIKGFTAAELIALANARPPLFEPGKSWAYAHSDLVLLGEVLQKATGKTLGELLQTRILDPLQMKDTHPVLNSQMTGPILHGYTNERGMFEDSTFWNPTAFLHSGNMNTTVADVATWMRALTDGTLLSKEQSTAMLGPSTAGIGPFTKDKFFAYGVLHDNAWIISNPSYGGYHGAVFHDSETKTLVIVYVTLGQNTPDPNTNNAMPAGTEIATMLVPNRPPA